MGLFKQYKTFIMILSIISAAVGAVLGALAELLYSIPPTGRGWVSGLILGFLIGGIYALLMARRRHQGKSVVACGTLLGIAAGLACSVMVHIILMITYRIINLFGMGVGAICGVIAGTILGLISSVILEKSYPLDSQTNSPAAGELT